MAFSEGLIHGRLPYLYPGMGQNLNHGIRGNFLFFASWRSVFENLTVPARRWPDTWGSAAQRVTAVSLNLDVDTERGGAWERRVLMFGHCPGDRTSRSASEESNCVVVLASSPEPAHSKSNGDDHVDKKLVLEQQDNDDAPAADSSWLKKICGIGPDDNETPESHLVYPLSPFGIFWLCLTAFFLG